MSWNLESDLESGQILGYEWLILTKISHSFDTKIDLKIGPNFEINFRDSFEAPNQNARTYPIPMPHQS